MKILKILPTVKIVIYLIEDTASEKEMAEMQEEHGVFIKVAVDIEKVILAGGGTWHADCQKVLVENGSVIDNIWGASYYPADKQVVFKSMINIRPEDNNAGREIRDEKLREKVERIIRLRLEL